jgi:hypothetical protein
MADITFSPVSEDQRIVLTRKQLKTIYKITKGTTGACDLVGHNPSATVELYVDPVAPSTTAYRHHISADGTYDSEQCEVPGDDGDWDWVPEGGWVDGPAIPFEEALLRPPAPKVKKRKPRYLSDKFTIRDNPNPHMDQQFEFDEVVKLPVNNVWTVVEGDNGKLYALTGFHIVNKLHYVVTEEPWTQEDEAIDYKW